MRIAVIGPGAMGILFASRLFDAGAQVALIDRDASRASLLAETGVTLVEGTISQTRRINILTPNAPAAPFDLAIVLVKANATPSAAETAAAILAPEGVALTLQNGVGGGDILAARLGRGRVLVGSTAQGATLLETGKARHGGAGQTAIGALDEGAGRRVDIVDLLSSAGLTAMWEDAILPVVWRKLAVNCGINPLTALLGCKNALIASDENARALSTAAVREVAAVARSLSIDLGPDAELCAHVLAVAERTGQNRSSMGQDVDRKRPTEIEFINGAVARIGRENGVATPVNETLAALVRALEATQKGESYGQTHAA